MYESPKSPFQPRAQDENAKCFHMLSTGWIHERCSETGAKALVNFSTGDGGDGKSTECYFF